MSERPSTFFLHAVGFTGQTLAPVAERVGGSTHCLDVIGHGAAIAPDGYVYSGKDAGRRVLEQVSELAPGARRYAFGHSGGGTALLWVELLAPGTFDAMFLYEPPARVVPPEAMAAAPPPPLAESVRYRRNAFVDHADFEDYLRKRSPYAQFAEDALAAYVRSGIRLNGNGAYSLACAPEYEASIYGTPDPELVDRLGEIQTPVVVACGENTKERFAQMCEVLADRLPRGRLVTVPRVTHFGPMEEPDLVAQTFRTEIEDLALRRHG